MREPVEDWGTFLADNPKVLWGLVADVVKAVKANQGERKTGRRPAVSCSSLDELYEILFPACYAEAPFPVALANALAGRTQRQFAQEAGYAQATVNRMLSGNGKFVPTVENLEHIASVLGIRPTYFAEYRALKIGHLVTEALLADPHLSADAVRRLFGATA